MKVTDLLSLKYLPISQYFFSKNMKFVGYTIFGAQVRWWPHIITIDLGGCYIKIVFLYICI
jgi:hypothetical protein